jgi:DNA polymerase-3 subunit delta'
MARRSRDEETIETDRIAGVPHPRETFALIGQDEALACASRAIRAGRPPQAWLIVGAVGVGKATFAYRIARYLLSHGANNSGPNDLAVPEKDPAAILVKSGAHPGLLVVKRGPHPETGKLMTALGVDEIRKLANFFGLTSVDGGWRIAIIDTADDMSDHASNALLKILEEPPQRSMLLLLSHAPAKLASTIRSRCQKLPLRPLSAEVLSSALRERMPDLSAADRARLIALSGGSLGAALRLLDDDGLKLAAEAEKLIDRAGAPDFAATLALAERVAKIDRGMESFGAYLTHLLAARVLARARDGAPHLDGWVELCSRIRASFLRSAGLHLEPRQTILSAAHALAARRAAP